MLLGSEKVEAKQCLEITLTAEGGPSNIVTTDIIEPLFGVFLIQCCSTMLSHLDGMSNFILKKHSKRKKTQMSSKKYWEIGHRF